MRSIQEHYASVLGATYWAVPGKYIPYVADASHNNPLSILGKDAHVDWLSPCEC